MPSSAPIAYDDDILQLMLFGHLQVGDQLTYHDTGRGLTYIATITRDGALDVDGKRYGPPSAPLTDIMGGNGTVGGTGNWPMGGNFDSCGDKRTQKCAADTRPSSATTRRPVHRMKRSQMTMKKILASSADPASRAQCMQRPGHIHRTCLV
ncbi:hypothetical protein LRL17_32815 (plasmid) [Rhodococcus qingshengii]|uniref:hypothetical protein n=1 Tax=Rhodococcus qingshengii TaxID=334542 RepID=UPI001E3127EF|nr:hypothetical protein [Rhodococcus qingshengii]UGQ55681.1 hypothetical protein LRL17_32815 [Rhodococcus qingshengii]